MSTASTMLTTIDTAISNIITGEVQSATIAGETFTTHNLNDLRTMRREYAAIVAGETTVTAGTAPFGITGLSAGSGK